MRLSKQARWSNPDRIVDLLDIDGGWLTVDGIADRLGISPTTASRALYRLRNAGLVESRYVELARSRPGKASLDGRSEWRTI
jgi:predicted transcriptional regulator